MAEEAGKIRAAIGEDRYQHGMFDQAGRVFEMVALDDDYAEFLTLPAYAALVRHALPDRLPAHGEEPS